MNTVLFSVITFLLFIAFSAAILSFAVSYIFFRHQKNSYRRILLLGLSGELIGLIALFVIAEFYQANQTGSGIPESLVPLPFFIMLVGVLLGFIWNYRMKSRNAKNKTIP